MSSTTRGRATSPATSPTSMNRTGLGVLSHYIADRTAAYGVGLYDEQTGFSDLLSRFHGHDERVSAESVERMAALYERILLHLGAS